jgi:23S rRNA (cytosine1962-C5)-methyltransferase
MGYNNHMHVPEFTFLIASDWQDYSLLDSGNGKKLEQYGAYTFIRPEHQALWKPAWPSHRWSEAHAIFHPAQEESGGHWEFLKPIPSNICMTYKGLSFNVTTGNTRHLGVFPEQACHWDWMSGIIRKANQPVRVLNLFGYTGLASLAAAMAGAQVTQVDASKKSLSWARQNQELSHLDNRPIRWLLDDAEKFVRREIRRGSTYHGIILDPPKFGRGPKGEVWEVFNALPSLLNDCRQILSKNPLFFVLTAYAIRASSLSIYYAVEEMMRDFEGVLQTGELTLLEKSAGRLIPTAIYARWETGKDVRVET